MIGLYGLFFGKIMISFDCRMRKEEKNMVFEVFDFIGLGGWF